MTSELKILNNNNNLIVSFGGMAQQFGGILPFEFLNFLNKHFINFDKYFFIDKNLKHYHLGIKDITKNIDETIDYLKNIIKNYKKVIFLGTSAGGYAAILFGSLLKINKVIAFIPQTFLDKNKNFDKRYINLNKIINNETEYFIYGDLSNRDPLHHINHLDNISGFTNVYLFKKQSLNLKEMRDSGELFDILNNIIEKNE